MTHSTDIENLQLQTGEMFETGIEDSTTASEIQEKTDQKSLFDEQHKTTLETPQIEADYKSTCKDGKRERSGTKKSKKQKTKEPEEPPTSKDDKVIDEEQLGIDLYDYDMQIDPYQERDFHNEQFEDQLNNDNEKCEKSRSEKSKSRRRESSRNERRSRERYRNERQNDCPRSCSPGSSNIEQYLPQFAPTNLLENPDMTSTMTQILLYGIQLGQTSYVQQLSATGMLPQNYAEICAQNQLGGQNPHTVPNSKRETGIVEKMLHNFGFVQCCDRNARLFFHFSAVVSDIHALKNGDEVEFQEATDRRTGKPIAVEIRKLEVAHFEKWSKKRYSGIVTYAPKHNAVMKPGSSPQTEFGRLCFERKGEQYTLSFVPTDVRGDTTYLKQGDKVNFRISTDERTDSMKARDVCLEESAQVPRVQGVVCSMKDNFGFIKQLEGTVDLFFHFSEYMGQLSQLSIGEAVEFEVHTRNGKSVATSIYSLSMGQPVFEVEDPEITRKSFVSPVQQTTKSLPGNHQNSGGGGGPPPKLQLEPHELTAPPTSTSNFPHESTSSFASSSSNKELREHEEKESDPTEDRSQTRRSKRAHSPEHQDRHSESSSSKRQIRSSSKSNLSNQSHSETQEHSSQRDSRGDTRRDHRHHSAHHEDSRTHRHRHQSSSRSSQDHHDYERSKYKYVRKQFVSQQCQMMGQKKLSKKALDSFAVPEDG